MHKLIVCEVREVQEIKGAENIQIAYVLGEPVVVSKDIKVGYVGLYAEPDLQLSEEYCKMNNLFRASEENIDQSKSGFFDSNRRVRAQPFMGVKSCGYFAPMESLVYCEENQYLDLVVGDQLDELNGFKLCKKYISEKTLKAMAHAQAQGKKKLKKVETPLFAQHIDTEQFKYNINRLRKGMILSFHHKQHGSSHRQSNTLVRRYKEYDYFGGELVRLWDRLRSNSDVVETWEHVLGTRRVILSEKNKDKQGYHGSDQWRFDWFDALKPFVTKGLSIYGEITGWANGKPIMGEHDIKTLKDKRYTKKYGNSVTYSYGNREGSNSLLIYRITQTLEDGTSWDYTPQQVEKWCGDRGFNPSLRVHEDIVYDGDEDKLRALVEELVERPDVLTEDYLDKSHISEGIVIRADCQKATPILLKAKSRAFRICEGIYKEDNIDAEDVS